MNAADRVDRILSLSAIVTAVVAVAVSLYEARIDRAHQKVSVWPYVEQGNSLTFGQPYRRMVRNAGIGPARIRSFQVRAAGRPVRTWSEAAAAVACGAPRRRWCTARCTAAA